MQQGISWLSSVCRKHVNFKVSELQIDLFYCSNFQDKWMQLKVIELKTWSFESKKQIWLIFSWRIEWARMPLSSGAHGWSLKYINKPPRPRKSPEHYFYTAEIPHSHKRYRRNTTEDNIPPVESIGQPRTRRPQWYPVNQHRLLEPDPFNFTHSSWEG